MHWPYSMTESSEYMSGKAEKENIQSHALDFYIFLLASGF